MREHANQAVATTPFKPSHPLELINNGTNSTAPTNVATTASPTDSITCVTLTK